MTKFDPSTSEVMNLFGGEDTLGNITSNLQQQTIVSGVPNWAVYVAAFVVVVGYMGMGREWVMANIPFTRQLFTMLGFVKSDE